MFLRCTTFPWLAAWAVSSIAGNPLAAAPKAEVASTRWQLDFAFQDPQRFVIQLPGRNEPTTYWYVLYTVTNRTGRDIQFFPSFRLVTNTLAVVEAGDEVSPTVYDAILDRHRPEHPFIAPPHKVLGPLLQGEENARTTVAVFRDFDPEASSFTVYVGGLSGEMTRVPNPAFDARRPESDDNPRSFALRRTLAVEYDFPGDAISRHAAQPVRRNREWIMR